MWSDVFADNKKLEQNIASAIQQCKSESMADIHLDSAIICIAEVLQDKQEPSRVGRSVLSKGDYFASTSETLQCHAYTTCLIALVVPKGCTIDQVHAPRDAYKVLKRIPTQQHLQDSTRVGLAGMSMTPSLNGVDFRKMDLDNGRPNISYDGRHVAENGDGQHSLSPLLTPTTTWPNDVQGACDQKPAPVKVCNGGTEKGTPMQRTDMPDSIPVIATAFSGDKDSLRDEF